MFSHLYITNTEKDTWEVRDRRSHKAYLVIIRWATSWEVQQPEPLPESAVNAWLRLELKAAVWEFVESEAKRRGETILPVYLYESWHYRPEPQPEPQQQKEEMPVWML